LSFNYKIQQLPAIIVCSISVFHQHFRLISITSIYFNYTNLLLVLLLILRDTVSQQIRGKNGKEGKEMERKGEEMQGDAGKMMQGREGETQPMTVGSDERRTRNEAKSEAKKRY